MGRELQRFDHGIAERIAQFRGGCTRDIRRGQQCWIAPHGHRVVAPDRRFFPAWQRLTRVPLTLAVMPERARRELIRQSAE